MRIHFSMSLDIERATKDEPAERESDVYAATENLGHPRMIGFQREDALIEDTK